MRKSMIALAKGSDALLCPLSSVTPTFQLEICLSASRSAHFCILPSGETFLSARSIGFSALPGCSLQALLPDSASVLYLRKNAQVKDSAIDVATKALVVVE